ncbi:ABC transporter ATP-binding protein, partial [Rhodoplanes roseus]
MDEEALIEGEVTLVELLGEVTLVYVDIGRQDDPVVAKLAGEVAIERGESVRLAADAADLLLFDESGRALSRDRLQKAA